MSSTTPFIDSLLLVLQAQAGFWPIVGLSLQVSLLATLVSTFSVIGISFVLLDLQVFQVYQA